MTAESYGMTDLHPYDAFSANAGAAGVGVGAAVQRARSRKEMADSLPGMAMYDAGGMAPGLGEHSSPYPAFSGPGAQRMYDAPHGGRYANSGNPAADLLEAAGMGAAGTHIRGPSLHSPQTSYSDQLQGRNLHGPGTGPQEQAPNESYATHYQLGSQPQNMGGSAHDTGGDEDAYGGYINSSHPQLLSPGVQLPNPYSPNAFSSTHEESKSEESDGQYENGEWHNESRASFRDEEDYELERGKRVLKVRSSFLFLL